MKWITLSFSLCLRLKFFFTIFEEIENSLLLEWSFQDYFILWYEFYHLPNQHNYLHILVKMCPQTKLPEGFPLVGTYRSPTLTQAASNNA